TITATTSVQPYRACISSPHLGVSTIAYSGVQHGGARLALRGGEHTAAGPSLGVARRCSNPGAREHAADAAAAIAPFYWRPCSPLRMNVAVHERRSRSTHSDHLD